MSGLGRRRGDPRSVPQLGVDVVFSSSGSEWAPVWEALARQDRDGAAGPTYLDLLHETLAVAMATGYGSRPGGLRWCCCTPCPVCSRAPTGSTAHCCRRTDGGRVIGVGDLRRGDGPDPGGQWYRNLSVVGGPQAVAAPFTKWSTQVGSVSTLYGSVVRAAELARRAPAGPVYLNIPLEVLLAPWDRSAPTSAP